MIVLRCELCGGELLNIEGGKYVCQSCGTVQILEDNSLEKAMKFLSNISEYQSSSLCHDASKKNSQMEKYNKACDLMGAAKSEKEFTTAANLFSEIGNYLDSDTRKIQCTENAKKCYQEETYNNACSLASQNSIFFLSQSIKLLENIPDFKDSNEKIALFRQTIKEQQTKLDKKNAQIALEKEKAKKKRKAIIKKIIIFTLIFLVVVSGVNSKKHNEKKITVEITSIDSEKDSTNYYVYLDYALSNKAGATVDYIEITTYFEDKSGKSLGTVTSNFGSLYGNSLNLKYKEKITQEIYLSERITSPNASELFIDLYDGKASEMKIKNEITYIKWSDGKFFSQ